VSADSRIVYRGMDIGTAKPSMKERDGIPHHLIDLVDPDEDFTVADFQRLAFGTIEDIISRRKNVIITGGTGLYIRSLTDNPSYQDQPPNADLRQQILDEIESRGNEALYEELADFDPEAAGKIHPNNIPRLVRALEVIKSTGRKFSDAVKEDMESATDSPYEFLQFGLDMDRELLYDRINRRVDQMIADGWVDEVQGLLDSGLTVNEKPMTGLGYRSIVSFLRGETSLDEAVELVKRDTRRFAKRQMTWFRGTDGISWIRVAKDTPPSDTADKIADKIRGSFRC